jgi:hypothetical protein
VHARRRHLRHHHEHPRGRRALGAHSLTARYNSDGNYATSTSPVLAQTIVQASTVVTLTSAANPAAYRQVVRLTARVDATTGTPTGTISFSDGTAGIGSCTLVGGTCDITTNTLAVGARSLTARYNSDGNFATATSTVLAQTIVRVGTSTTLTITPSPVTFNSTVTFSVRVDATTATPAGTVTVLDGTASVGTCSLTTGGACTVSTRTLGTVIVKLALPEFELVVPVANEARAAWTFSVWIAVALGAKFESPA